MLKKSMAELERISSEDYSETHSDGLILVLDNLRSAHNVGSIFRTADSFGISKMYLCGITCKTDNRELQKTALGAENSVNWEYAESSSEIVNSLKSIGYKIYSLEQTVNSHSLLDMKFDMNMKTAFVIGNEVEGVSEEVLSLSDVCIEIPQIGSKHSLNVSNASSILLWEYFKSSQL